MSDEGRAIGQQVYPYNGASGRPYPTSWTYVFFGLVVTHGV